MVYYLTENKEDAMKGEQKYTVSIIWRTEVIVSARDERSARTKAITEFPDVSLSRLPEIKACDVITRSNETLGYYLVENKNTKMPVGVCQTREEAEDILIKYGFEDDFNIIFVPVW
jgi:hypothetical protein